MSKEKKDDSIQGIQDLVSALNSLKAPKTEAKVGVRNICGSTVGLPPYAGEAEITITPYNAADPNSVAIITAARWAQVRKSGLFGQGLIERFDDVLDASDVRAPEDRPEQCHPDHAKNRLPDPVQFIEETDEGELRARIMAMTSENQVHHILGTVDEKMRELERKFLEEGDPDAARRAIRELPMRYQAADQIAQQRLEQITKPNLVDELPAFKR